MKTKVLIGLMLGFALHVKAGNGDSTANLHTFTGVKFATGVPEGESEVKLFGKKRNTLAAGVVIGDPVGVGARGILKLGRFGIAGDAAIRNLRLDDGQKTTVAVFKLDGRFYGKGFLGKLLRAYCFGGATILPGVGQENEMVVLADAGLGGGIKLGRISINGEVGLNIPVRQAQDFRANFDLFGNVGIMFWLF